MIISFTGKQIDGSPQLLIPVGSKILLRSRESHFPVRSQSYPMYTSSGGQKILAGGQPDPALIVRERKDRLNYTLAEPAFIKTTIGMSRLSLLSDL